MSNKISFENFEQILKNKFNNDNLKIIQYESMRQPCIIQCNICKKIFKYSRGETLINSHKEKLCNHKLNKDEKEEKKKQDFIEQLNNKYKDESLEVIEFSGRTKPCEIKCLKCNSIYKFKVAYHVFENKTKVCKKCFPRKDTIEIGNKIAYLLQKTKNLKLLNSYNKITDDLQLQCLKCNGVFYRKPQVLLKTQKCPYCESFSCLKTEETYNFQLQQKRGNSYSLVGQYNGTNTNTLFRCNECGFIFKSTPNAMLKFKQCPKCKKSISSGEQQIRMFLAEKNIDFIPEKTFSDLPFLRFDFFLPDYNLLIEYQGQQHYYPIDFFGGEKGFLRQQANDRKKKEYCIKNNYHLLEIGYWQQNKISDIIESWLNDYKAQVCRNDRVL